MRRPPFFRSATLTAIVMTIGLAASVEVCAAAQRGGGAVGHFGGVQANYSFGGYYGAGYATPYFGGYGGGWYGGYSGGYGSTYSYLPNYWWTGYYPTADPRGEGYNPNAGYAWDSVTTLLLETFPAKARVTLDGIFVGTTDTLGPFQLPLGQHTLRIEAAGFEPSETVLKVERAVLQQLEVRLTKSVRGAKPAPRPK